MPAIDILQLAEHEGVNYAEDLNLMFAASGDVRNLIKTIGSVPDEYKGKLFVVMNDKDPDVVARNAILLLVNLLCNDEDAAADLTLHLWYSAFLKRKHVDFIINIFRPLVEKVVGKFRDGDGTMSHLEPWTFDSNSLSLELTKAQWYNILSLCSAPISLSFQTWQNIRRDRLLWRYTEQEKKDYFEQRMVEFSPMHRACKLRFQEDGIFLPFGHSRVGFVQPNPTLFLGSNWAILEGEDPFGGWSLPDVLRHSSQAQNDLYGRLYFHIKDQLRNFHRQLRKGKRHFQLLNVDARELRSQPSISSVSFARIETSNIADVAYVTLPLTLYHLSPLLQQPSENQRATMLTLFMNAVPSQRRAMPLEEDNRRRTALMEQFLPFSDPPTPEQRTRRRWYRYHLTDNDFWFDQSWRASLVRPNG